MVTAILPGIYRLQIPLPGNPLKELNSYLIRGQERSLLVDTGFRMDECRHTLLTDLREIHQEPDQLDIFLTHAHADHSGLAPEIIGTGGKILVGQADISRLDVEARTKTWAQRDEYFRAEGFVSAKQSPGRRFSCIQYDHYVPMDDGDVLHYGDYSLTCIATPGHSPGHMCLYLPTHKAMLLGDHVLFGITPNITSWMDFPDALGQYLASLRRIDQYDVVVPLPGHRGVNSDMHTRIQALYQHHTARLWETLTIVRGAPGLSVYEIAGRMTWNMRCSSWSDFPESQKTYAVGEALAHLDYLLARGYLEKYPGPDEVYQYYTSKGDKETHEDFIRQHHYF